MVVGWSGGAGGLRSKEVHPIVRCQGLAVAPLPHGQGQAEGRAPRRAQRLLVEGVAAAGE